MISITNAKNVCFNSCNELNYNQKFYLTVHKFMCGYAKCKFSFTILSQKLLLLLAYSRDQTLFSVEYLMGNCLNSKMYSHWCLSIVANEQSLDN